MRTVTADSNIFVISIKITIMLTSNSSSSRPVRVVNEKGIDSKTFALNFVLFLLVFIPLGVLLHFYFSSPNAPVFSGFNSLFGINVITEDVDSDNNDDSEKRGSGAFDDFLDEFSKKSYEVTTEGTILLSGNTVFNFSLDDINYFYDKGKLIMAEFSSGRALLLDTDSGYIVLDRNRNTATSNVPFSSLIKFLTPLVDPLYLLSGEYSVGNLKLESNKEGILTGEYNFVNYSNFANESLEIQISFDENSKLINSIQLLTPEKEKVAEIKYEFNEIESIDIGLNDDYQFISYISE
ncbi:hypothetical protein H3C67_04950 [Candidatus Dojkabacteria bacterium]|uniref:Uncharacterized protein n=1 Tax=Candidatus Dojkabacteria bacterium TaxID=2099670 RepID=A0A952DW36_9BACT|nr:hypothetical protein [Candidatus Dojkabacteria bacterium]